MKIFHQQMKITLLLPSVLVLQISHNEDVALSLAEAVLVDAIGKQFAQLHVRLQLICHL